MAVSQRLYEYTKKKLDELQARLLLEKIQDKKITIPELIDKVVEFAKLHEDEFKQMIKENPRGNNPLKPLSVRPEFLQIIADFSGIGYPEDFEEYDFNDI